jgi:hypothetical protein
VSETVDQVAPAATQRQNVRDPGSLLSSRYGYRVGHLPNEERLDRFERQTAVPMLVLSLAITALEHARDELQGTM